jgi:predicted nucleic acid-binding protein
MNGTVVDASTVAAVLFDEAEAEPLLASIAGELMAPTLLVYEIANICAAKLIVRPADAYTTLARYKLFADLEIELIEPDWVALPTFAIEWTLSAYDAAYLQLALARKASLVTLDARLAAAYDRASKKLQ